MYKFSNFHDIVFFVIVVFVCNTNSNFAILCLKIIFTVHEFALKNTIASKLKTFKEKENFN